MDITICVREDSTHVKLFFYLVGSQGREISNVVLHVLRTTQNLVLSRCSFAEDGNLKCTNLFKCLATFPLLIALVVFSSSLFTDTVMKLL